MDRRQEADEQRATVRREFAKQASNFEAAGSLFRASGILDWIAAHIEVGPGARILDVAGGTGQMGRHLARDGATAVIVDLTDAMLAAGLRSVLAEGRGDVVFVRGDAIDLPFPDAQFDVVVSRFALHHMDDPGTAIEEMARVCRPDGSVTLVDMVGGGARHDELERLRDPSHTRALPEDELRSLLSAAGREARREARHEQEMPVGAMARSVKDSSGREGANSRRARTRGGGRHANRAARQSVRRRPHHHPDLDAARRLADLPWLCHRPGLTRSTLDLPRPGAGAAGVACSCDGPNCSLPKPVWPPPLADRRHRRC